LRVRHHHQFAPATSRAQAAVAKGFDKISGFGEGTYVALIRQLDVAGQNFRD
jgi:hypothetical protein